MNEIHNIEEFINHPEISFLRGVYTGSIPAIQRNIQRKDVCLADALPAVPAGTDAHETLKKGYDSLMRLYPLEITKVLALFSKCTPADSPSMRENLVTKFAFWMQKTICPDSFRTFPKTIFVYTGTLKKQEFLFCYFLTLLKIRVLVLSKDETLTLPPALSPLLPSAQFHEPVPAPVSNPVSRPASVRVSAPVMSGRQELSYEALARLASSVVLIQVEDENGTPLGSGSGIMIGTNGYLLTNFHVACRGARYSIRIEDDTTIYHSDELIKYNQFLDLALIRIDRKLTPLPLYDGRTPLVRGQKVVAIGSPMGLFNTVSDGIISGFRTIEDAAMIQFTAPISSGSSGGAVLNMYGEVIGISTSGLDKGQNLNLAMPYDCILNFVRGFL